MAEYRIHWAENGMVQYSWHRSRSRALTELLRVRKRLGLSENELSEFDDIVRFDLHGSRITDLVEFLNEHVNEGPSCAA